MGRFEPDSGCIWVAFPKNPPTDWLFVGFKAQKEGKTADLDLLNKGNLAKKNLFFSGLYLALSPAVLPAPKGSFSPILE